MPDELTIASVLLPGRSDVFKVTLRDGLIAAIRPAEQTGEAAWLALPGLVNLHAHADRAYTVQSFRPRSLADAVAAAASARALFTAADIAARAMCLFERSVEHGSRGSGPTPTSIPSSNCDRSRGCWRRRSVWRQARCRCHRVLDLEERSGRTARARPPQTCPRAWAPA